MAEVPRGPVKVIVEIAGHRGTFIIPEDCDLTLHTYLATEDVAPPAGSTWVHRKPGDSLYLVISAAIPTSENPQIWEPIDEDGA